MPFVKATPNDYLVIGRGGKTINRGTAVSAFLWPGWTYVIIPSTKQEACFEMTQESKDGVPLRFKGIVMYRVTDPEAVAKLFDFTRGAGHRAIQTLISHVCLGELRALVSHLSMEECIEQRKTTLTDAIAAALRGVLAGQTTVAGLPEQSWGIDLDVVQVAQVFIVDDELRRQLEAEVRNKIKAASELAHIRAKEEVRLAQILSERRLQHEALATERAQAAMQQEKLVFKQQLEQSEIEAETPVRLLRIEKQREVLRQEMEARQLENQVRRLEVEGELLREQAKQQLRKEILPLEQVPTIAQALSKMFAGANLSVYGENTALFSSIGPILDLLTKAIRDAHSGNS